MEIAVYLVGIKIQQSITSKLGGFNTMKVRCIQRIRNKQGKITDYLIQREDGVQAVVNANKMKQLIASGSTVENLRLTSDNRLIYVETVAVTPRNDTSSRVLIDSSVLEELMCPKSIVSVCASQKQDNNIKEVIIRKAKSNTVGMNISTMSLAEILDSIGIQKERFNSENSILGNTNPSNISLHDFMSMLDKSSKSIQDVNSNNISNSWFMSSLGLSTNAGSKKVYLQKSTIQALDKKLLSLGGSTSWWRGGKSFKLSFKSNISTDIVAKAKSNNTLVETYQNGDILCIIVDNNIVLASQYTIALPKDAKGIFEAYRSTFSIIDVSQLDTSEVVNMGKTFTTNSNILNFGSLDTSKVEDMSFLFSEQVYFDTDDFDFLNGEYHGDAPNSVNRHINHNTVLDTHSVKIMRGMFAGVEIEGKLVCAFDTSNVENMVGMFIGAGYTGWFNEYERNKHKVKTVIDISNLDTHNVKTMRGMFNLAYVDKLKLSNIDTSNVEDMSYMFCNFSLDETDGDGVLDLSSFDTRKVKKFEHMFEYCYGVSVIKVGKNWTLPDSVFNGCGAKVARC